VELIKAQL